MNIFLMFMFSKELQLLVFEFFRVRYFNIECFVQIIFSSSAAVKSVLSKVIKDIYHLTTPSTLHCTVKSVHVLSYQRYMYIILLHLLLHTVQ